MPSVDAKPPLPYPQESPDQDAYGYTTGLLRRQKETNVTNTAHNQPQMGLCFAVPTPPKAETQATAIRASFPTGPLKRTFCAKSRKSRCEIVGLASSVSSPALDRPRLRYCTMHNQPKTTVGHHRLGGSVLRLCWLFTQTLPKTVNTIRIDIAHVGSFYRWLLKTNSMIVIPPGR